MAQVATEPRKGEYAVPEGADLAACHSCSAPVVWVTTDKSRRMPLSVNTIVEREGQKWALAHFSDCPHGKQWSHKFTRIDPLHMTASAIAAACDAWEHGGCLSLGLWLSKYKPRFTVKDYAAMVALVREELGDDTNYSKESI